MGFFMKIKFEKVQQAFIDGVISLEDFIQILVDTYGQQRTKKILEYNLKLARQKEKECENTSPSETE